MLCVLVSGGEEIKGKRRERACERGEKRAAQRELTCLHVLISDVEKRMGRKNKNINKVKTSASLSAFSSFPSKLMSVILVH